jgi:gliding motility-associated-like protein
MMLRTTKFLITTTLSLFVGVLHAQLKADFKADITRGCKPVTVNFTDISTGNPVAWKWDFGNGNISTSASGSVGAIYLNPGTYTVKLIVTNSLGKKDSITKVAFITVFDNPKAGFTASPTIICVGQPVTFTDKTILAQSPIKTWTWVFGDGNSQITTVGTSGYAYTFSNTFPVTLIVTDTNKCTSNITSSVTVAPGPKASFTASPTTKCGAPLTTVFTNTSTVSGTVNYKWYFGDGVTSTQTNPQHTYTANGIYSVSLVVVQGACKDSTISLNLINLKPLTVNFKADTTKICIGQTVAFTDLSSPTPASYNWDFGDGGVASTQNPTHTYVTAGTYGVSLRVSDSGSCSDSLKKVSYVTVAPFPIASFTFAAQPSCKAPVVVNFTDASTGATSWSWDFGDGATDVTQNPSHTYAAGNYTVKLTVKNTNGCSATFQTTVGNLNFPKADFTAIPLRGCVPLDVAFTSISTSATDPIVSYDWDYGDGTATTTNTTINHIYNNKGTYTVKLVITTAGGCKDSTTKVNYILVGDNPVPDFTLADSTICFGVSEQFTDLSTNGTSWFWYFGDGGTSNTQNPQYVYGDTGTFNVKLVVYNNGCADSITKPKIVTVYPPKPVFSFVLSCSSRYRVLFTDASVGADSLTWDFGDGTFDVANNKVPSHTYLTRGAKTVKLTAFNKKYGCSFSASKTFTIADPVADFSGTPLMGCYPLPVSFTDNSIDGAQYKWTMGDGNSLTIKNPSNTYSSPGKYSVKLLITDVNGCKDSVIKVNYVYAFGPTPYFKADVTKGCSALNVLFTDTTRSDSALVQWAWDFGDGATTTVSSGTIPHTYVQPGSYTVSMTVTDKNGCAKTLVKSNYIVPTFPKPKFVSDTLTCRAKVVSFDASATNAFNPAYKWSFADGSVNTTASPLTTHSYNTYGLYNVTLVVTDGNGCVDSIKHSVLVHKPTANFSDTLLSLGCGIAQVQFKDLSTGFVNKWLWDFGNGATSVFQNPSYTYTQPGYNSLRLIVTSIAGCVDTLVSDSVVLVPGAIGAFSFNPKTGCNPLKVKFKAKSINAQNYTWDFGDGTVISTTVDSIVHIYNRDLNVKPIVLLGTTLPDGSSCQLPATNLTGNVVVITNQKVNINPKLIKLQEGDFTYSNPTTNIVGPFVSQWSPATGLDCSNCFDVIIRSTNQDMIYSLSVIDTAAGGCVARDTLRIINVPCLEDFLLPNVFTPNGDGVNDILKVKNLCPGFEFEMSIYNRWGELIYATMSNREGWDGKTTAGAYAPSGTYYYIVKIHAKAYTGFVQLLKE